jgi:uncharacterized membrane protein YedE/YeeE
MKRKIIFLIFGILFGFTLSKVGASDYNLIYSMFTGADFTLPLVMGTAIVTAAIGMKLISFTGSKGFGGQKITVHKKLLTKYTAFGGIVFGIGWAMSGACPGTVLAQIGEGKVFGMVTMAGAIFGTYIYAVIAEKNKDM